MMEDPDFKELRKFKGKVDVKGVESILQEVVSEIEMGSSVTNALIYVYSLHYSEVRSYRELFNVITKLMEKFAGKLGADNVANLIRDSLK
ncbi:hypothetical protein HS1genome_0047 [Sulfodiicoccus acidiphilus]|uniref:Calcium binding protein SSO6904 domain-containing protein n=1 Tax=Sulfodiicoccus acidiphilus TaxID=1670455 RepID=A0A348B0F6_9CREN|nr:hypothetical protein HS1genome_0047 [Sulfodiicoccus acidiphilus]